MTKTIKRKIRIHRQYNTRISNQRENYKDILQFVKRTVKWVYDV